MRVASAAVVTVISAIALYFTYSWGADGIHILTSPSYGLDDVWRSQFVFGIGRLFDAAPESLLKIAAVFGAIKLIVASIFGLHVLDRVRSLVHGKADLEILETALALLVIASLAAAAPALWTHNGDIARDQTVPLLLAALAAALCIVERMAAERLTQAAAPQS
ncbi:MAG TPA: hypothetical protein VFS63_09385 [Pseudolabrys sp.]|jgi:hypothetical protein|nr:hypothetical protein [Pseudolabrys sp.]